jgi:plastocyanin
MKRTLCSIAMVSTALAAQAGPLSITVTDKDGKPAPDVVVLVDMAIRPAVSNAPVTATIVQQGLKFQPFLTVVPAGSTLRFINRDGYDHHVRAQPGGPLGAVPPAQDFELRLDAAEHAAKSGMTQIDVKLEKTGPIALGCHLHSSMRGQVYVSPTPWFGKTDASGVARIDAVPDGPVQITLWHPDQLQEQAPLRADSAATPVAVSSQLNFVPRRRRR